MSLKCFCILFSHFCGVSHNLLIFITLFILITTRLLFIIIFLKISSIHEWITCNWCMRCGNQSVMCVFSLKVTIMQRGSVGGHERMSTAGGRSRPSMGLPVPGYTTPKLRWVTHACQFIIFFSLQGIFNPLKHWFKINRTCVAYENRATRWWVSKDRWKRQEVIFIVNKEIKLI